MGLFSATDIDAQQASREFQHVLLAGENVLAAFRTIRDTMLLTDMRIVYVNVQGITGSKVEYQSIPWRSVIRFSIETAGTFDLDADMKVWVSGAAVPIEAKISRKSNPNAIQQIMSEHVLGRANK
jgi:hypothetical protein